MAGSRHLRRAARAISSHAGELSAPVVVHPPQGSGGRRGTVRGQIVGLAHTDTDFLEFLRGAGRPDAEGLLNDPSWVLWRGGRAHHYEAA